MTLADEWNPGAMGEMPDYAYNIEDVYARRQDLEAVRQGIKMLE